MHSSGHRPDSEDECDLADVDELSDGGLDVMDSEVRCEARGGFCSRLLVALSASAGTNRNLDRL